VNLTRDQQSPLTVRNFERGSVTIGDEVFHENVMIFRGEIIRDVPFDCVATVQEQDLEELLARQPQIVIFGTGWSPQRPPRELVFAMARRGIGFETMDTPAACRTFNILLGEGRDAAAVLIVAESGA